MKYQFNVTDDIRKFTLDLLESKYLTGRDPEIVETLAGKVVGANIFDLTEKQLKWIQDIANRLELKCPIDIKHVVNHREVRHREYEQYRKEKAAKDAKAPVKKGSEALQRFRERANTRAPKGSFSTRKKMPWERQKEES